MLNVFLHYPVKTCKIQLLPMSVVFLHARHRRYLAVSLSRCDPGQVLTCLYIPSTV